MNLMPADFPLIYPNPCCFIPYSHNLLLCLQNFLVEKYAEMKRTKDPRLVEEVGFEPYLCEHPFHP